MPQTFERQIQLYYCACYHPPSASKLLQQYFFSKTHQSGATKTHTMHTVIPKSFTQINSITACLLFTVSLITVLALRGLGRIYAPNIFIFGGVMIRVYFNSNSSSFYTWAQQPICDKFPFKLQVNAWLASKLTQHSRTLSCMKCLYMAPSAMPHLLGPFVPACPGQSHTTSAQNQAQTQFYVAAVCPPVDLLLEWNAVILVAVIFKNRSQRMSETFLPRREKP